MLLFYMVKYMKKILFILLCFFSFFTGVFALEFPNTYATKVLVYDKTEDKSVYEKNTNEVTSIASLTKLMTVYVAVSEANLEDKVLITNEMLQGIPYDLHLSGLKAGEEFTLREICYAAIIDSGADATNVIAYKVAGSINAFVDLMNKKASELGLTNTHFANVHGLDDSNHYSTINDLNKLIIEALKNNDFKDIYNKNEYKFNERLTLKRWYEGILKEEGIDTNNLLGGKTGFTEDAGMCYAGYYLSDEHEYLIIVIGADGEYKEGRNIRDFAHLAKFIDDNYNYYTVVNKGDIIGAIPTFLSEKRNYLIKAPEDIKIYLPSDYSPDDVHVERTLIDSIMYNSLKGKTIGNAKFYYKDKLIGNFTLYLDEDMKLDIPAFIDYYTNDTVLFICVIVLIVLIFIVRYFAPARKIKKNSLEEEHK